MLICCDTYGVNVDRSAARVIAEPGNQAQFAEDVVVAGVRMGLIKAKHRVRYRPTLQALASLWGEGWRSHSRSIRLENKRTESGLLRALEERRSAEGRDSP